MGTLVAAGSLLLLLASHDVTFDFKGDTEVSGVHWEKGMRAPDGGPGVIISFTPESVSRLAAAMKEHPGEALELTLDGIHFARQLPSFKASDNWALAADLSPGLRARLNQIEASRNRESGPGQR